MWYSISSIFSAGCSCCNVFSLSNCLCLKLFFNLIVNVSSKLITLPMQLLFRLRKCSDIKVVQLGLSKILSLFCCQNDFTAFESPSSQFLLKSLFIISRRTWNKTVNVFMNFCSFVLLLECIRFNWIFFVHMVWLKFVHQFVNTILSPHSFYW